MKRPRISLRTLFLTVIAIAVWMAVAASYQQGQDLKSRVRLADWQNENEWQSRQWSPRDPSRLQMGPRYGYEASSLSDYGEHWIHVPGDASYQVCVCYRNIESPHDLVDRVPDVSAPLPAGTHVLRWDSLLDAGGKRLHHGVLVDDRWLIQGKQELETRHRLCGFYDRNVLPNEVVRLFYAQLNGAPFDAEAMPGLAVWIEKVPDGTTDDLTRQRPDEP